MPVTGHNGELRVKQEARAEFAAMSRDHVTEEDMETFARVQELAAQVRKRAEKLRISVVGPYFLAHTMKTQKTTRCKSRFCYTLI